MLARVILEYSNRELRLFISQSTGVNAELPVILTDQGVLEVFARYIYKNRAKSPSWMEKATYAVRMLLEYVEVNRRNFDDPRELFCEFAHSLYAGTVQNRSDPTGLWWYPLKTTYANELIGHVTLFSDWISEDLGDEKYQLNPWREATKHEQRLNWAAYIHRRDNAFMSHLWRGGNNYIKVSRYVRKRIIKSNAREPVKVFPEGYFKSLIIYGFSRRARDGLGACSLRDICISYLLHYGGLRVSEALGIWREDVTIESGKVVVRIFHPEIGLSPDMKLPRIAYLEKNYALKPRNKLPKSHQQHLGWKECVLTDETRNCFEVFFFPEEAGEVFANLWREYHFKQRVSPSRNDMHPYAFTSKNGQPYSHRMYRKAHGRAVERIGLEVAKLLGTTPHGHRHAYGQTLAICGAEPLVIQRAMHHSSVESSQTYTEPTGDYVREHLRKLDARMHVDFEEIVKEVTS
jgi:integrase